MNKIIELQKLLAKALASTYDNNPKEAAEHLSNLFEYIMQNALESGEIN